MTLTEAIEIIKKSIGRKAHDKRTLEHKAIRRVEGEYMSSLEFERTQAMINSIIDEVVDGGLTSEE